MSFECLYIVPTTTASHSAIRTHTHPVFLCPRPTHTPPIWSATAHERVAAIGQRDRGEDSRQPDRQTDRKVRASQTKGHSGVSRQADISKRHSYSIHQPAPHHTPREEVPAPYIYRLGLHAATVPETRCRADGSNVNTAAQPDTTRTRKDRMTPWCTRHRVCASSARVSRL